jgi:hypothetical protein
MKKTLFYFLFLFNTQLYSQGNLEFNQVLSPNITISGSITFSNGVSSILSSSNLTVPTGKVWKIESIFTNYTNIFTYNYSTSTYTIQAIYTGGTSPRANLVMLINGIQARPNSINEEIIQNNAIWLKAGDLLSFQFSGVGSFSGGPFTGGLINIPLSIIEFNVVP